MYNYRSKQKLLQRKILFTILIKKILSLRSIVLFPYSNLEMNNMNTVGFSKIMIFKRFIIRKSTNFPEFSNFLDTWCILWKEFKVYKCEMTKTLLQSKRIRISRELMISFLCLL